jgi:hypothetical protein
MFVAHVVGHVVQGNGATSLLCLFEKARDVWPLHETKVGGDPPARPALISLLSLSTISADVFLGAPMPNQPLASYRGTRIPQ